MDKFTIKIVDGVVPTGFLRPEMPKNQNIIDLSSSSSSSSEEEENVQYVEGSANEKKRQNNQRAYRNENRFNIINYCLIHGTARTLLKYKDLSMNNLFDNITI
jgi:hypothetical protein